MGVWFAERCHAPIHITSACHTRGSLALPFLCGFADGLIKTACAPYV